MAPVGNYIFGYLRYFGLIGGQPIGQKWTNLEILQNANQKGVFLCQKMRTRVFVTPHIWPFWTNRCVCESAQFGRLSKIFRNFLYEIQIERGWFYEKNAI